MSKILIRTDGNYEIGLGHLVRCIALANMLKDNFDITFFCIDIPENIINELYEHGFGLRKIKNENEFYLNIAVDNIVVIDGYKFDASFQKQIKTISAKLVCIDDIHEDEYFADLIINPTPGIIPGDYKAQFYTSFALGPEYVLLRSVFLEQAKKLRKISSIRTLMICFGGSDFKNLTYHTLKVAVKFTEFEKIIVVTGSLYKISEEFSLLIKSDKRIDHRQILNENLMLHTMLEADLAIVPASGILFEVLAAGCIPISGYYVNNQLSTYIGFKKSNQIIAADNFSMIDSNIQESFRREQLNSLNLIDGKSNLRILSKFINL